VTDFDVVREPLLYMLNGVPGRGLTEVELRPMLAALARIGAENERATKRAGELMAENERLREALHQVCDNADAGGPLDLVSRIASSALEEEKHRRV